MALAKKDRFISKDLKIELKSSSDVFPLDTFNFEGHKFFMLGISNKNDLYPLNIEEYGLHKAVVEGKIGQYIYTREDGVLFDVFMYSDEADYVILGGIRTRDLP